MGLFSKIFGGEAAKQSSAAKPGAASKQPSSMEQIATAILTLQSMSDAESKGKWAPLLDLALTCPQCKQSFRLNDGLALVEPLGFTLECPKCGRALAASYPEE